MLQWMMRILFFKSLVLMCLEVGGCLADSDVDRLTSLPGHMKPFGSSGPFFEVPAVQGFPSPREFFDKYVAASIPVVMHGAGKLSPAFMKWTDEFFIQHPSSEEQVLAESRKKEDRTKPGNAIPFRDFVKRYKTEDIYMVNGLPYFLRPDVLLPQCLKCAPVLKSLSDAVMWFSSGGTKSVLHNDDVDNINCLYRGNKTLVFISPFETDKDWMDQVVDRPAGTYSDLDVDAVDYTKYPQLANVRYGVVKMTAGDCLFIPYKWLHQVNSFGNNLAVNVWFNHFPLKYYNNLSPELCGNFDETLSLDQVQFETTDLQTGAGSQPDPVFDSDYKPEENEAAQESDDEAEKNGEESGDDAIMITVFKGLKRKTPLLIEDLKAGLNMLSVQSSKSWNDRCQEVLQKIFDLLDANKDSAINVTDYKLLIAKKKKFSKLISEVDELFTRYSDEMYYAQQHTEREFIKDLVRSGNVDFEQARAIYGENFVEGIKPQANLKEEL